MAIANVTVAYVNQPKDGAKKGTIKTEDGQYYGVWADKLFQYAQGGKYTVEYEESTYQGKTYKTIKRIIDGAPGRVQPITAVAQGGGQTKAAEMFAMGMLNRSVQGLGVEAIPDEDTIFNKLVALRAAWTSAWAAPLGPQAQPAPLQRGELNDEIPF